jgi:hypothetical protein
VFGVNGSAVGDMSRCGSFLNVRSDRWHDVLLPGRSATATPSLDQRLHPRELDKI